MTSNAPLEKPGRAAWFVFRSLARYLVSLFIPSFRYFGETDIKLGGQIFIEKNYGFQSWAYPLTIFKRPVRFIVADIECDDMQWFNTASDGGLFPIMLSGNFEDDYEIIKSCVENNEKIVLIISQNEEDELSKRIVKALKEDYTKSVLFMALSSGAKEVFANNAVIPKSTTVTMVCGMPFTMDKNDDTVLFNELHILEKSAESATDVTEPLYLAYLLNK